MSIDDINAPSKKATAQLIRILESYLQNKLKKISNKTVGSMSVKKNIMDMGVDSVGLVDLTTLIEQELKIPLQPTVFFEYQNISELADHMAETYPEKVSEYFMVDDFVGHREAKLPHQNGREKTLDKTHEKIQTPSFQRCDYRADGDLENPSKNTTYTTMDEVDESLTRDRTALHKSTYQEKVSRHQSHHSLDELFDSVGNADTGSGPSSDKSGAADAAHRNTHRTAQRNTLMGNERRDQYLDDDIAIIGMGGMFADSPDVDTFWQNIVSGKNLFSQIPAQRFEYEQWCDTGAPDSIYCTTGSFIDDVDKFDAEFFNVSAKEAQILDPQLRLLLQVIYSTVEDAGYGNKIRGSNTGMYVGACFHDYEIELIRHLGEVSPYFGTGNALTMLANRPSFYLDLKGPSMPVDTACSASLVAINTAISALRQKECDMAFVAGTNLLLSPVHYRYFCSIGALSKSGHSYPFDKRADGYVPGEAVGAVLLKPLKDAIRDQDRIHAVVKGAAIGHGGYSSSFTAPSVSQEAKVMVNAWQRAGIEPESISYIEAHGTGTALGDPIEVNGIKSAFQQFTQKQNFCALGTAKAHIGHAEGAAGIAGLIKVILSMKNKTIPAMPHIQELNPYVDVENSALYVNRQAIPWESQEHYPRRAGISSFGIGGAYAHVVVEEYLAPDQNDWQDSPAQSHTPKYADSSRAYTDNRHLPRDKEAVIVLSARDEERLQVYAQKMADFMLEIDRDKSDAGQLATDAHPLLSEKLLADLTQFCADSLNLSPDYVKPDQPVEWIGFGAINFIKLSQYLEDNYQIDIQAPELAIYKSIKDMVETLVKNHAVHLNRYYEISEYAQKISQSYPLSLNTRFPVELQDIAFTLQSGREAMEHRLALVVSDKSSAARQLKRFAEGETDIPGLYLGKTDDENSVISNMVGLFDSDAGQAFLHNLSNLGQLNELAQLWVCGGQVDWNLLPQNKNARLLSLPGYPFVKQRFWFDQQANSASVPLLSKKAPARSTSEQKIATENFDANQVFLYLTQLFKTHLSVKKLNPDDDFIDLGGNSIITTQMVSEINQHFAIEMTTGEFLNAETLSGIHQLIEEKIAAKKITEQPAEKGQIVPVISARNNRENVPLSADQMRLWILAQMYSDNTRHNISAAVKIPAQINPAWMQQALNHVIDDNESLRTTIASHQGQPVQLIHEHLDCTLQTYIPPCVDDPCANSKEKPPTEMRIAQEVVAWIKVQAELPFSLESGPLFRVSLIHVGEQYVVLSLIVHHIIADIQSTEVIVNELIKAYGLLSQGEQPKPQNKVRQFADYVDWQRNQGSEQKDKQLAYWKNKLDGAAYTLNLPFDRPRGDTQSFAAAQVSFTIDESLYSSLKALAKTHRVTQFVLMFSLFNLVIAKTCQQKDLLIGCPNANRSLPELRDMVGFLANTMVLRTQMDGIENFTQLLQQIKNTVYDAFDHQDISYADVVEALKIPAPKNHNPLFQILFNMVERASPADQGVPFEPYDLGLVTLDFDMLFTLEIRNQNLIGFMDYNPELFNEASIMLLIESFKDLMLQVVEASDQQRELTLRELGITFDSVSTFVSTDAHSSTNDKASDIAPSKERLTVVSTFVADPVLDGLEFWINRLELNYQVEFAPYNQLFQQLLDPSQLLHQNQNGVNLILFRFDDWVRFEQESEAESLTSRIEKNFEEFIEALKVASQAMAPILLMQCPTDFSQVESSQILMQCPTDFSQVDSSQVWRLNLYAQLSDKLQRQTDGMRNIHYINAESLTERYAVSPIYDPVADQQAHVPYTPNYYLALGSAAIRFIHSIFNKPYKVVVLDCDNTLWGGICGEGGAKNVNIDPARQAFQEFLVQQHDSGILLCLCSKNVEIDVMNVFNQRDDMPLKLEHIVAWKINWEPKSKNIRELASELNLGIDSFIFIDDNPMEIAEVKSGCPEVLALQFPQQQGLIERFYPHIWGLDKSSVTQEDKKRTSMYRQNIAREREQKSAPSFTQFLESLELNIEFDAVNSQTIVRVEQLMMRTNQFNATSRRHTAEIIQSRIDSQNYHCTTVKVSDRFGDYGLVGVMFYQLRAHKLICR